MNEKPSHKPFEWADEMFSKSPDVEPKYRDMLAMLAMTLMGNGEAAQHFYAKAVIDGASDDELRRSAEMAKMANLDVGDLPSNVQRAVEEIRAEREAPDDDSGAPPSLN
jgi:hypothetical protein